MRAIKYINDIKSIFLWKNVQIKNNLNLTMQNFVI
jgi:hypothetical protein